MPKRRASAKRSASLGLRKMPPLEQNTRVELHVPCKNCHDLNPDLFATFLTTFTKVKESKESGCQFCRLLYETYSYYRQENDCDWQDLHFTVVVGAGKPVLIERRTVIGVRYPCINIYAPLGMIPAWNSLGSMRDNFSDAGSNESFLLQKSWMDDCLKNHKKCYLSVQKQMPKRVVLIGLDNRSLRLVETQGTELPYAALSHCWGGKQPLQTTLSTFQMRKEGLEWDSMPATFKDAITVTRKLGIRYLWIDSLCIIQNDDTDWESEAAKMADIYEGAQLVIAASSSPDPDTPFLAPRKTPCAKPLELNLDYERQQGVVCKVKARPTVTDFPVEPLDERAWTFQEQWLARRLLQFHGGELKWRCLEKESCECQGEHLGTNIPIFRNFPSLEEEPNWILTGWYTMIGEYTKRQLTRMSDRLPALSGIAARVSAITGSTYIAGLWEDSLVFDLQWRTVPFVFKEKYKLLRNRQYLAPTFSWISIPGQTTYRDIIKSSIEANLIVDAKVCDAHITVKGVNPFGEVLDGFIILEGPLISATLSDSKDFGASDLSPFYTKTLLYDLERGSARKCVGADLPLVVGTSIGGSGTTEPTVKRASEGDLISPLENAPVWCLGIFHGRNGSGFALILGLSSRVSGAYERLGAFNWHEHNWFEDAHLTTIKIV